MITFVNLMQWGAGGTKAQKLYEYLKDTVDNRYVTDNDGVMEVKAKIEAKMKALNKQYPQSKELRFKDIFNTHYSRGAFSIYRAGTYKSIMTVTILNVQEYQEGGAL